MTTNTDQNETVQASCAPAAGSAAMTHPLAHRQGICMVLGILMDMGAMCPKCGFGTRVTSKKWAKCKRCGERVARRASPQSAVVSHTGALPDSKISNQAPSPGVGL